MGFHSAVNETLGRVFSGGRCLLSVPESVGCLFFIAETALCRFSVLWIPVFCSGDNWDYYFLIAVGCLLSGKNWRVYFSYPRHLGVIFPYISLLDVFYKSLSQLFFFFPYISQ